MSRVQVGGRAGISCSVCSGWCGQWSVGSIVVIRICRTRWHTLYERLNPIHRSRRWKVRNCTSLQPTVILHPRTLGRKRFLAFISKQTVVEWKTRASNEVIRRHICTVQWSSFDNSDNICRYYGMRWLLHAINMIKSITLEKCIEIKNHPNCLWVYITKSTGVIVTFYIIQSYDKQYSMSNESPESSASIIRSQLSK